jgi:hypothetical protein
MSPSQQDTLDILILVASSEAERMETKEIELKKTVSIKQNLLSKTRIKRTLWGQNFPDGHIVMLSGVGQ